MPICLNNQGVRTPSQRAPGIRVHTFRHDPFVKSRFWRQIFPLDRKDPLARLKTRNSPFRQPLMDRKVHTLKLGNTPLWPTPPQAGNMAPERPFPALIDTGNSYPKTGLSRRFNQRFCRWFSGGFLGKFDGGWTAVFRQHASPGSTPSRLRPPPSSERNCRQFRTQFQAYKPSIAAFSKVCL